MVPFVVLMPNIIFARPSAEAEGHFGFFFNFFFFAPIIKYVCYDPGHGGTKFFFIQIAIIETGDMPQKVLFDPF
jgi:hypothetical protein